MALASTACARSTQAASSPAKGSTVKAARSAQPKTAHVPAHLAKRTDAELATLGDQLLDKNLLDSALLAYAATFSCLIGLSRPQTGYHLQIYSLFIRYRGGACYFYLNTERRDDFA